MIDVKKLAERVAPGCVQGESIWLCGTDYVEQFAALVLEEAAKVCDEKTEDARAPRKHLSEWGVEAYRGAAIFCDECAAAIRELKEKT